MFWNAALTKLSPMINLILGKLGIIWVFVWEKVRPLTLD